MSISILEFEKPIAEVTEKIEALQLAASDNPELLPKIDKLKLFDGVNEIDLIRSDLMT